MFAIMIRVIRAIRSLVDSVFVQKYVIEVYVSMSFCLRAIRVIRSLVDSVFMQKYVIEVYVSTSFCLLISFCLSNVFTISKSVGHK